MHAMNLDKFLKGGLIEEAVVPPRDNFLSAKFEAAVPTEAHLFLGCFKRTAYFRQHCQLVYVIVTMNGFLYWNSITT
jgi:hypothetical protein